jgi:hypothetical protein
MAIVPVHKAITKEALDSFGFTGPAVEMAMKANAAVDQHQGDEASETNLHSMRGYFFAPDPVLGKLSIRVKQNQGQASGLLSMRQASKDVPLRTANANSTAATINLGALELVPDPLADASGTYRLQTKEEAEKAVSALLSQAKAEIVKSVLQKKYTEAITRLGEALHTVQDRVFHHFEPWPYKDIPDSLMKSPSYMMCHALRDMGYISKVGATEHQFALGVAMRVSPQGYVGADFFGPTGSQASMSGFRGWGGLLTYSYGAAPGSVRQPDRGSGEARNSEELIESCLDTEGVGDKAKATDDSKAFVKEIEQDVEAEDSKKWQDFINLKQ